MNPKVDSKTPRLTYVRCNICGYALLKDREVFIGHMRDSHKRKAVTESAIAAVLSSKATSKPPKEIKLKKWGKPRILNRIFNADPNTPDVREKSTDMLDARGVIYPGCYRG